MRREIPLILTAVVGITLVVQYFIPHDPVNKLQNWFADWVAIIQAFAIWLGALNLLKISAEKVYRQQKGWGYSGVIILSFFAITLAGFFFSGGRQFQEFGTPFDWFYSNIFTPLSATMFSILAFFVASASYRAFRARTREATLLLLAAFFVMLGRVPVGDNIVTFLPRGYEMSDIANWIMNCPQLAGQRAIMIGIALGIVSTSLRIILGIERSFLGGE